MAQDTRFALRQLAKSPGFTIAAVLPLALGIGANIAGFSVMNAILLNPTGVPHPESVAAVRAKYQMAALGNISLSPPDFATNTLTDIPDSGDDRRSGLLSARTAGGGSRSYAYVAGRLKRLFQK